jgi:hypothetical protein
LPFLPVEAAIRKYIPDYLRLPVMGLVGKSNGCHYTRFKIDFEEEPGTL